MEASDRAALGGRVSEPRSRNWLMFRLSITYVVHDNQQSSSLFCPNSLNIMMMLSHLLKNVQATLNTLLHPGIGVSQDQIGSVSGQKTSALWSLHPMTPLPAWYWGQPRSDYDHHYCELWSLSCESYAMVVDRPTQLICISDFYLLNNRQIQKT